MDGLVTSKSGTVFETSWSLARKRAALENLTRSCLNLRNCLKVPSSHPSLWQQTKGLQPRVHHTATCSHLPRGWRPDLSESAPLPLLGQIAPLPQLLRTPSTGT